MTAYIESDGLRLRRKVRAICEATGERDHIFNLGHGITPQVDPENVATMVAAVHEMSEIGRAHV